ncbi:DUF3772 domain-containing protein [Pseudosulfitobacter sp. DSM 107133]|uniref:DUF3772 domain-containing protein n=1 Tax=Pseudosulfitobacter sp. DSM 107133 TaxID=2883100 RepID=UPI000DF3D89B|nr:DUF3772 domain-containing protein [Pseudosulfitobacter sp. DSM 107133]UOA27203.1 putative MscS family protein.1 [Pseudosulfitobacter sp. DSM 107133]
MRIFSILLTALFLALASSAAVSPAWAQETGANAPDYSEWETVAKRAEQAVEAAKASDSALTTLRAQIVEWRSQFQTQLSTNDSRLATLREQVAALGAPPADDAAAEAPEIASRRTELNEQLERLTTPRRTAEEAFSRANGIISEIDAILRTRQADELLNRGPTPLNPALWGDALSLLGQSVHAVWSGTYQAWSTPSRRGEARDNLPLVLVLVVLAVVLLARSRSWSEQLAVHIARRESQNNSGFAGFVVSLGQIFFPLLGVYALILALGATQLYGPRGELILRLLPAVGICIFFARWIGSRMFPASEAVNSPLGLPEINRTEGRFYSMLLGFVLAANLLVLSMTRFDRFPVESQNVLSFPLIVLASILTFRVGQLLRNHDATRGGSSLTEENAYRNSLVSLLGRAAKLVAIFAPLLAAAGYVTGAERLIYPAILSLALFATIALLQEAVNDAYAFFSKTPTGNEGLMPTLIGFFLLLASLPLFALIWGARVTDLTELWARARAGVAFGDMTLSPSTLLTLTVVFFIGLFLTRMLQGTLKTSVLPKTKIDPGGQVAMVSGVGYIGIFLAALVAITSAGIDLSSLAFIAGALSLGIGFGLQNIVSNFVSGIILLIERPISEGDWIEVGGQQGYVRDISVRSTRIETFDRTDVIVPNADLVSGTVTNYTRGNTVGRLILKVGVAYGTDTMRVDGILRAIAKDHPMVLENPAPNVVFMGFGADSLDFEIRAILRDVNWLLSVRNDMNHQIAAKFAEEKIEIPFAQRDIWLRNPEVLQGARTASGSTHVATAAEPVPKGQPDEAVADVDSDADTPDAPDRA